MTVRRKGRVDRRWVLQRGETLNVTAVGFSEAIKDLGTKQRTDPFLLYFYTWLENVGKEYKGAFVDGKKSVSFCHELSYFW